MVSIIETPRLALRGWRDEDRLAWIAMCADPRVMTPLGGTVDPELAAAGAEHLAARLERDGFGWWIVEVKGGPAFAGLVALQHVPIDAPFTPAFEVGWRFRAEAWGNGYATEGGRAALEYAFDTLGHEEVVAMTARINLPSQRVMQRLGMTYDPADDFEHPSPRLDATLRPHVLYRARRSSTMSATSS